MPLNWTKITVVKPQASAEVECFISENCFIKENEVAVMLDVSHGPIYLIFHDVLQLHKVSTRQVP
jgi:hypothetical protein